MTSQQDISNPTNNKHTIHSGSDVSTVNYTHLLFTQEPCT